MPKARKVLTPGSQSHVSPGRGRPKKAKERSKAGYSRVGNYRSKYTQAVFLEAMEAVQEKRMSFREAAKHYGVPKTTLIDRIAERYGPKLGHPIVLTAEEETIIVERLIVLGEWGFPFNSHDLTHLVKNYLDSLGRSTRFVNNLPGPDFVRGFLKRHPQLTVRTANLIKRGRAALTQEEVIQFFDRYEKAVEGILPENMFNYDETNLRDNPGKIHPTVS